MKKIYLPVLLILFSLRVGAQDVLTFDTPNTAGGEVKACEGIILSPGFSFTATPGKSMTFSIDRSVCSPRQETIAAGSDKNYVITITPLDASSNVEISGGQLTIDRDSRALVNIQYFDGLGRPVQTVQRMAGGQGEDLVTAIEHDNFGREWKSYLPVPVAGNNGAFVGNIPGLAPGAYSNDPKPYSEAVYEPSPLNRIEKQYGPGQNWRSGDHSVKTKYLTNNNTDSYLKCALYSVSGDNLVRSGNYEPSQLYVMATTDEDGNKSYEFTDKRGQVVLTRQINDGENHDTYYVYDDFGNKRFMIPSLLADSLPTNGSWNVDDANANGRRIRNYAYVYKYDYRNRCIEKKLPGCAPIYMVYDRADRLILSQDGNQRDKSPKEWTFNKYDIFGRVVISGVYYDNKTRTELETEFKENLIVENRAANAYGYSWNTMPRATYDKSLQINYYDDYEHLLEQESYFRNNLNYENRPDYDQRYENGSISAKGLLIGTRIVLFDHSAEIVTAMYYDNRGRIIQKKSTNHLGGFDREYYAYTFTGLPKETLTEHSVPGKEPVTEKYSYNYDHAGRLLETKYKLNNSPQITLVKNEYNNKGQLASQKLNNKQELVAYDYNIRGWLKKINSPKFREQLYYESQVIQGIARYNGNISVMTSLIAGGNENVFRYAYDNLNRLIESTHTETGGESDFSEWFVYDKMGNITGLQRYGRLNSKFINMNNPTIRRWVPGLVDDLDFRYSGNQILSIQNNASVSPGFFRRSIFQDYANLDMEYGYDKNGNMTMDLNKEISTIQYNSLNLPQIFQTAYGNTTEYVYSSTGMKHRTVHKTSRTNLMVPIGTIMPVAGADLLNVLTTDYITNKVYENGTLKRILTTTGYVQEGQHYTYLKDHLGNNCVVLDESQNVVQQTVYYASGSFDTSNASLQPYLFGGKEYDPMHGLNVHDFLARQFDSSIMRFTSPDPMSEKYPNVSIYAYCGNNPIRYIDLHGDSISVAEEHREQFMNDMRSTFGDKSSSLSFNASGNLVLNGKSKDFTKGMSSDQKQAFKGLNKAMTDKQTTSVVYANTQDLTINGEIKSVDIVKEFGGGLYSKADNMIVIAPNVGTVNVTLDEMQFVNGTIGFPTQDVQQNTTSTLFHEVGERNTKNLEYRGAVIDFENYTRKIIGLPVRPYDLNHSNKVKTIYK